MFITTDSCGDFASHRERGANATRLRNGHTASSLRWIRQQQESGWRLKGRLHGPVPGLPPSTNTWSVRSPCTALSHNRVRPLWRAARDAERNTKESVTPCPRGLTGENSPLYTNQPAKTKTDRVPVKYILASTPLAGQKRKLWRKTASF